MMVASGLAIIWAQGFCDNYVDFDKNRPKHPMSEICVFDREARVQFHVC